MRVGVCGSNACAGGDCCEESRAIALQACEEYHTNLTGLVDVEPTSKTSYQCVETELNVGGYPAYKRRQLFPPAGAGDGAPPDGWVSRTLNKGKQDSAWVVPYNAYLLTKFQHHP